MLDALLAARSNPNAQTALVTQARNALKSLVGALNSASGSTYLFAGVNSGAKPMQDYFTTPAPPSRQSVGNAFQSAFGITLQDPAASAITPQSMQSFLDGSFAAQFTPGAWQSTWSTASDQVITSQVSASLRVDTSVSANDIAFRTMASAYTMIAELGSSNLAPATLETVIDRAVTELGKGMNGLTNLQSSLGGAQQVVADANTRVSAQRDILAKQIGGLEDADSYAVGVRLNTLTTQLEASYSITARIQRLTILNYI